MGTKTGVTCARDQNVRSLDTRHYSVRQLPNRCQVFFFFSFMLYPGYNWVGGGTCVLSGRTQRRVFLLQDRDNKKKRHFPYWESKPQPPRCSFD